MTRALVEDSIGRSFGGQSASHYSSDRRENRNTCFLTVVSGRVVGNPYLGTISGLPVTRSEFHTATKDPAP